ncbi:hypothetical protein F9C11_20545 [Amycolatopsis sp. VS8301801F10]|uniref:hypothetical protein n=1 Tax=unclassified Amycolatopsis TaxID=2618356 RepID=UPI0038FCDA1A
MGNQLRTYVHVADEAGQISVFGPGDELPGWARSAITNPKAWADSEDSAETAACGDGGGGEDDLVEPPRSGKGSSVEAWRDYAEKLGWFEEIPADATRDDIVKAVDEYRAEHAKKTGE